VRVHHTSLVTEFEEIRQGLVGTDASVAHLFLRLADETAAARGDEPKLLEIIKTYSFQAFPRATHMILAVRADESGEPETLIAASRSGEEPAVVLSRTLWRRVMTEDVSLLFSENEASDRPSKSLILSEIRTAICAPLRGIDETFGIIQLDIRGSASTLLTRQDLDRLTVFAHHVALVLDNLRLAQKQRRAIRSAIDALVHSLYLKDPDTAQHSIRVRAVALCIGETLGLTPSQLESLGAAAVLHDVGKQGVPNRVLKKPAVLTEIEIREMARHSRLTENILDKIYFPPDLKDVPLYAAYHHEKMNGSGPYGLAGEEIPIQARIISVADVFDALLSRRVYKEPKPPDEVLAIFEKGRGTAWDPRVIDAVRKLLPRILAEIYEDAESGGDDYPVEDAA
jgi:HD-GYP domain-containing protein (c-di-GMP phosphodiesterase class II)